MKNLIKSSLERAATAEAMAKRVRKSGGAS